MGPRGGGRVRRGVGLGRPGFEVCWVAGVRHGVGLGGPGVGPGGGARGRGPGAGQGVSARSLGLVKGSARVP